MDDWEIVSIEMELDRLRDEKENSNIVPAATGKKSGCGKLVLWLCIGLLVLRFVAQIFS
jgi:hypothetical protein